MRTLLIPLYLDKFYLNSRVHKFYTKHFYSNFNVRDKCDINVNICLEEIFRARIRYFKEKTRHEIEIP